MEATTENLNAERIASLNDSFRQNFNRSLGQVFMTSGVVALEAEVKKELVEAVQQFDHFPEDDDPYGEHDFGAVVVSGDRFYFKIDYYDPALKHAADDPGNPSTCTRVLTIMRAEEY